MGIEIAVALFMFTIIFSMVAKDERDTLDFKPDEDCFFPKWDWYKRNNWETKSKILKNVLTLFLDGRHWWEWWNELIKYYALSYVGFFVFEYGHWWANGIAWGSFMIGGFFHSLRDGSITRYFKKESEDD